MRLYFELLRKNRGFALEEGAELAYHVLAALTTHKVWSFKPSQVTLATDRASVTLVDALKRVIEDVSVSVNGFHGVIEVAPNIDPFKFRSNFFLGAD